MPESSSEPMHALMPSRHEDTEGGWTTSTVLSLTRSLVSEQEKRFALALSALDERISLRFDLAEQARQIALTAQETAMRTALAAQEKLVSAALESAEKAVTKAETASEKRFEGVNEFRAALSDQQRNLMPRSETDIRFGSLEIRINEVSARIDARIVEFVARSDLRYSELVSRMDRSDGKTSGSRELWALIAGGIMLALGIASFYFARVTAGK